MPPTSNALTDGTIGAGITKNHEAVWNETLRIPVDTVEKSEGSAQETAARDLVVSVIDRDAPRPDNGRCGVCEAAPHACARSLPRLPSKACELVYVGRKMRHKTAGRARGMAVTATEEGLGDKVPPFLPLRLTCRSMQPVSQRTSHGGVIGEAAIAYSSLSARPLRQWVALRRLGQPCGALGICLERPSASAVFWTTCDAATSSRGHSATALAAARGA